jgi:hypothetical protein
MMLASLFGLVTYAWGAIVAQDVDVNPTSDGIPGGSTIQNLLDWGGQYALWASLGAILAGGGMYGFGRWGGGGYRMAATGNMLALGGGVGALLVGLGPTIINALYDIAS